MMNVYFNHWDLIFNDKKKNELEIEGWFTFNFSFLLLNDRHLTSCEKGSCPKKKKKEENRARGIIFTLPVRVVKKIIKKIHK